MVRNRKPRISIQPGTDFSVWRCVGFDTFHRRITAFGYSMREAYAKYRRAGGDYGF